MRCALGPRSLLVLALASSLACATANVPSGASRSPGANPVARRAKSTVQGLVIGSVLGGSVAGLPGAAVGSAAFGLFGLATGRSFYDGPNRHRNGSRDAVLDEEVEEALETGSIPPPSDRAPTGR